MRDKQTQIKDEGSQRMELRNPLVEDPSDPEIEALRKRKGRNRILGWTVSLSIMGVLIAMALPSFLLKFVGIGCELPPLLTGIDALNQGQYNFYMNHRTFATSIFDPRFTHGIEPETDDYKYSIHATKNAAFSYGIPKKSSLRSQVGAVFVVPVSKNHPEVVKSISPTASIFCAADLPGVTKLPEPFLQDGTPTCPKGTQVVKN
ncbi:hypothetical protein TUMEXPCC7403_22035 [Tumidithrix helvetica PCC 7403]|uniref:type IV pilin-like G/H family protein n=1 Tax=Tumidithrix helvetica TaxID=3457545 RepID=UPI003CC11A68